MATRRGIRTLLFYKRLIAALRRREGGTARYRQMHAAVRGTPAEETFWAMMREMAHALDVQRLLDRQNRALLGAARARDVAHHRLHRTCGDCSHWTVPAWDTKGWGTCYQRSSARDSKRLPVVRTSVDSASFQTVRTFSCASWRPRV